MTTKIAHRWLVIWSTLAAASGCGQLLGLSDYEIDPSLQRANNGGQGGEGGDDTGGKNQGGTSNGGEPMAEGGNAGEPSAPTAGAAGAGGTASDERFKGCTGVPFDGNEAIVRSCILRVGCQIFNYPTDTISRCVSQNTQNTYEGTKCTLDATSCADITACEGTHIEDTFCTGKADGQYCNGNEVVTCGDYPYARDCTKSGGTCHDFGAPLGGTTKTVDCILSAVTTCAATTTEPACGGQGGGYKYQCQGTLAYGVKCSNFAASCDEVGGEVGCYYPSNTCSTEGVTCANDRATWCDGTTSVTYDCGSVGLGCQTEGDYYADSGRQCAAPGCTATEIAACKESCDGSSLTFCYGGAPVTVDCKAYGFTKCAEYDYDCSGLAMNDCLNTNDTISFAECE